MLRFCWIVRPANLGFRFVSKNVARQCKLVVEMLSLLRAYAKATYRKRHRKVHAVQQLEFASLSFCLPRSNTVGLLIREIYSIKTKAFEDFRKPSKRFVLPKKIVNCIPCLKILRHIRMIPDRRCKHLSFHSNVIRRNRTHKRQPRTSF